MRSAISTVTDFVPRRVVSLQPSATVTLRDLGLLDRLAACTKFCLEFVPEAKARAPLVVHDSWNASAAEILAVKPDWVIASVPYQLESVAEILKAGIPLLALAPHSLRDVYSDIAAIARVMAVERRGMEVIAKMQREVEAVRTRTASFARPRVFCEEWGKPIIGSQPWVAELIAAAGGEVVGAAGAQQDAQAILKMNPEVVIAAWCGAGDRVPLEKILRSRGWDEMNAAKRGRIYCIRDEFLNTPASTLTLGLQALAWAIHPEIFPRPEGIRKIGEGNEG